jgi:hypothetical protein
VRSNRRLVRKYAKALHWASVREALRMPVPIFSPMWMNFEVLRMGKKIREQITRRKHNAD